jgi:periplasmic protein CpxP/Spy
MLRNNNKSSALLLSLALIAGAAGGTTALAQDWHHSDDGGPDSGGRGQGGPGAPPMERSFRGMDHGRWWDNPRVSQQIGLTDDQKKKMDDISQQHRLKIIDLDANLQKQEAIMHPLIEADQPDESKILSQIDAIASARAELEKDRARMLFSIRQTLTPDQWKKLQAFVHQGPPGMGRGGPDGRDGRESDARDGRGWKRGGPGSGGPGSNGQGAQKAPQPPADGQAPPTPPNQ